MDLALLIQLDLCCVEILLEVSLKDVAFPQGFGLFPGAYRKREVSNGSPVWGFARFKGVFT